MLQIELIPDLTHCIETVTKREYEETMRQLLAGGAESDEQLGKKFEILRIFLEAMDFKRLRQESEKYLVEGRTVKFMFYLEDGAPEYQMRVT